MTQLSKLADMLAVPARFRSMTDEELNGKFDWRDSKLARHERDRRHSIRWTRDYIESRGPTQIAEHEAEIASIRKHIASECRRLAKLESNPA